MTTDERIALALALGREAVALYARVHGVTKAEARRAFEQAKQAGRRASEPATP